MSQLKNITINERYKVKHFIESTSFCDLYTAQEKTSSKFISLSIYNDSEILEDDLDHNGDLREIGFLRLGIDGFPMLMGFGDFLHKTQKYRYIATEFISGESVMDRMRRHGPLSLSEATTVALRIAKIAKNLHNREKPILLNGLSLNNIIFDMSTELESIVLRNLINVRFLENDFKYEYTDDVLPNNLADECYDNVFTPATDQFNIGSLFYQMMHGHPPWNKAGEVNLNNKESIEGHLRNRDNTLEFSKSLDIHLKGCISKCLDRKPDNRFRNMNDFSAYLKREKLLTNQEIKLNKSKIKQGNGFKDIAGMESLKNQLQTQVLDVLRRPEHFKKYDLKIPNGMLLYGPPGCGKTFISEKFCEEAAFNFFLIKPSDLSSIYISGGEERIGQLFKEAEENSPSVICFDEVDAIMPHRTEDAHQSISSRVNEFLTQINKCSERGIFVIATTNKPKLIDLAMLRSGRLEFQIYVPPPDEIAREKLFELYLKNRYCETKMNYKKLSELTKDIVSSDVEFIVNQSAHKAAMLDVKISMNIIIDVLSSFKPSVSKDLIDSYEKEHLRFSNNDQSSSRKRIGF